MYTYTHTRQKEKHKTQKRKTQYNIQCTKIRTSGDIAAQIGVHSNMLAQAHANLVNADCEFSEM
jgi:hypothetical protein